MNSIADMINALADPINYDVVLQNGELYITPRCLVDAARHKALSPVPGLTARSVHQAQAEAAPAFQQAAC